MKPTTSPSKKNLVLHHFLIASLFLCSFIPSARGQSILASANTRHSFSDSFKQDIFKLTLRGSSLLEAKATFDILDANGSRLYTETFDADMLLKPEVEDVTLTSKQQEEYILKRVREFFKEENFLKPAIDLNDEYDVEHSPDIPTWNALRADRTAIGFSFLLGNGYERKIAWLKRSKKVIVYWTCC